MSKDPRARARKHLERLVAASTSLAAGIGLTACTGYGVVDPMPPPACQGSAADLQAAVSMSATWKQQSDSSYTIEVAANLSAQVANQIPVFQATADADGGTATVLAASDSALAVEIVPSDAAITLTVSVACDGGSGTALTFDLDASATPHDGEVVPVTPG